MIDLEQKELNNSLLWNKRKTALKNQILITLIFLKT